MCSTREEITEAFASLATALSRVLGLTFDALTTPERLALLEHCETARRQLPSVEHTLINQIGEQSTEEELGGKLGLTLADRLRITRSEAKRRVAEAADLGQRRALTGEPLPPLLTATAKAQRHGLIGDGHVEVIRAFVHRLPSWVDLKTLEKAERDLAKQATQYRPDQLAKLAARIMDCLNPDGDYTDEDRARRRGLTLGKQDVDGMSRLSGYVTPELRATIEAVWAKLAAPGMCNPEQKAPCVNGAPSKEQARRDTRSCPQRNHDALNAELRSLLTSGNLGQHNGLPASIIVTTTLKDLRPRPARPHRRGYDLAHIGCDPAGPPRKPLPRDIRSRQGPGALPHQAPGLPAQRIMLYAKDSGCSAPGCDVPGYYCEVHHVTPYAQCRNTDVNDLTLGCGGHHPLAERGWTTRKNAHGDTEWLPPPHLDHGQPRVNTFHHPEKLLADDEGDP